MRLITQLIFMTVLFISQANAAEHIISMKNQGSDGFMVFEPAVLNVKVGDTVHFEPTDLGHNAESVDGLIPKGASAWKGVLSKKVSVVIDKEGVYVYQCAPHLALAMVGVIVADKPSNLATIKAQSASLNAKFATNKDRLNKYLSQVK